VVMSACPQDITAVNNKRPMVAHFVVESPSEADRKMAEQRDKEAQEIIEKARKRTAAEKEKSARPTTDESDSFARPKQPAPKPGRAKPKKLDRRASSASSTPKS